MSDVVWHRFDGMPLTPNEKWWTEFVINPIYQRFIEESKMENPINPNHGQHDPRPTTGKEFWDNAEKPARNTGGDVNYYLVDVKHPKRVPPYTMEVEDIIEALDMSFAEGTILKSLIRRCQARKTGIMKKSYDGPSYDAEKIAYYGQRLVAQNEVCASGVQVCPGLDETVDLPRYHGEFRAMAQGRADYTLAAFPIYTEKYGTLLTIAASEEAVYVTQAQAAAFFDLVDRYSLNTLRASHGRLAEALKALCATVGDLSEETLCEWANDKSGPHSAEEARAMLAARAALAAIPEELAS